MRSILLILPLLAAGLNAADVSGKWAGNIEVNDTASGAIINTPVRAEFQQKDGQISGTIGRREDDQKESIRNGRIEDGKLQFEVISTETTGTIRFVLTLDGNKLEGEMRGAIETGPISGKVHLVRAAQSSS